MANELAAEFHGVPVLERNIQDQADNTTRFLVIGKNAAGPVGGGNVEKNVSPNLVKALRYAKEVGSKVVGVVGRDGGYTAQVADAAVIVPVDGKPSGPQGGADEVGVGRQVGAQPTSPRARRAVFLDRDGVLNRAVVRDRKPYPPAGLEGLDILPGVPAALDRLQRLGFLLIVVTNQPDVARGDRSRESVDAFNAELARRLPLDDVFVCFHDDPDGCDCRKPLPGLLARGAERYGIGLERSYLVGDRWRDIAAGQRAGVRTVFIDYDYDERRPEPPADVTVKDLSAAVDWIESHA